mmetsp:Transcript_50527/g.109002  ORF Transcript_50527/g.109002 Transcript_50527/m.109002 type:complete len:242 (-) Transcript_50527:1188-1913(-)
MMTTTMMTMAPMAPTSPLMSLGPAAHGTMLYSAPPGSACRVQSPTQQRPPVNGTMPATPTMATFLSTPLLQHRSPQLGPPLTPSLVPSTPQISSRKVFAMRSPQSTSRCTLATPTLGQLGGYPNSPAVRAPMVPESSATSSTLAPGSVGTSQYYYSQDARSLPPSGMSSLGGPPSSRGEHPPNVTFDTLSMPFTRASRSPSRTPHAGIGFPSMNSAPPAMMHQQQQQQQHQQHQLSQQIQH